MHLWTVNNPETIKEGATALDLKLAAPTANRATTTDPREAGSTKASMARRTSTIINTVAVATDQDIMKMEVTMVARIDTTTTDKIKTV